MVRKCASCHSVTGDLAHIGSKYDAVTRAAEDFDAARGEALRTAERAHHAGKRLRL